MNFLDDNFLKQHTDTELSFVYVFVVSKMRLFFKENDKTI